MLPKTAPGARSGERTPTTRRRQRRQVVALLRSLPARGAVIVWAPGCVTVAMKGSATPQHAPVTLGSIAHRSRRAPRHRTELVAPKSQTVGRPLFGRRRNFFLSRQKPWEVFSFTMAPSTFSLARSWSVRVLLLSISAVRKWLVARSTVLHSHLVPFSSSLSLTYWQ